MRSHTLPAILLACGGAVAGHSQAQSSVTVYGLIDMAVRTVSNSGVGTRTSLANDGINGSRIGFRGVEDLGGGLRTGFWLEGTLVPDIGGGAAAGGGLMFNRRSTLSLIGPWGELRIGRDHTPTLWNMALFDPFAVAGIGTSLNTATNITQTTYVRSSNSIGYLLPPGLGGWYGQAMFAPSEDVANSKHASARLGYARGPLDVAVNVGQQDLASGKFKFHGVVGSYDFGLAKLMSQYLVEKTPAADERRILLGTVVPLGLGQVAASYVKTDIRGTGNGADQYALSYRHFLSKRTTIQATFAEVGNKGASRYSLANGVPGITAGGTSRGFDVGFWHTF